MASKNNKNNKQEV